jgi:hypothetical protein
VLILIGYLPNGLGREAPSRTAASEGEPVEAKPYLSAGVARGDSEVVAEPDGT